MSETERNERIAGRAFEIYVARGAGEGKTLDDWLQAEAELRANESTATRDERAEG